MPWPVLVVVIAAGRLIADRRLNIGAGLMLICGVGGNTRIVVENKIVEASVGAGVDNTKKVLTGVLFNCNGVGDANNPANDTGTNKVVTAGGSKKEVYILLVLVVVIGASRFIINGCI